MRYQSSQSGAGALIGAGSLRSDVAHRLSKPAFPSPFTHGVCFALLNHWQPLRTRTSLSGTAAAPIRFAFWFIVTEPWTTSGPPLIAAVLIMQRFPST